MTRHRPPTRTTAAAVGVVAALASALSLGGAAPTASATPPVQEAAATAPLASDGSGTLLAVLDSSGSMAGAAGGGQTKIQAARQALDAVVRSAPATTSLGMRVYGATSNSCTDSQLVVVPGVADAAQKARLSTAVGRYAPRGNTPIAWSLQQAAADLRATPGRRTILLVSDGEETCHGNPCTTAAAIAASGVDLKVDVVGLRVDPAARRQLQCIAAAGHGDYYDAADAAQLTESLTVSTLKAARPFRLTGTPVHGAVGSAELPTIGAGQYLDTLPATESKLRYRIRRTPGSTVRMSTTLFVAADADPTSDSRSDSSNLAVTAPDGTTCDTGTGYGGTWSKTSTFAVTTAVVGDGVSGSSPQTCVDAPELILTVQRGNGWSELDAGTGSTPVELLVSEQGPVTNETTLPAAAPKATPVTLPAPDHAPLVPGGTSFSDAPAVPATGGRDTIRPGETLVYRVPLRWGQQPSFRVDLGGSTVSSDQLGLSRAVTLSLRGPDRGQLGSSAAAYTTTYESLQQLSYTAAPITGSVTGPQVRYANRSSFDVTSAAVQGSYYLVVTMATRSATTQSDDFGIPLTVSAAAVGAASGTPVFQALASSSGGGASAVGDPGGTVTPTGTPAARSTGTPTSAEASTAGVTPAATPTPAPGTATSAPGTAGTDAGADRTTTDQAGSADTRQVAARSAPTSWSAVGILGLGGLLVAGIAVAGVALLRRPTGSGR